jgi:Tol biopolymer transport system component/DNA-binding winged helix-turn-helix (wHTH) protein
MQSGFEFGPFRLDPVHRTLTRGGKQVSITPKVFDVLLYLVQRHGCVVSKEELLEGVWPDTAILEANLSQSIFLVRKALGESAKSHSFIVTTPGRGYAFVAEVKDCPIGAAQLHDDVVVSPRKFGPWRLAAAGIAIVSFASAALRFGAVLFGNREGAPPLVAVPLTAFPGGEYEPAFSPDGDRVAFVWNGERQDNYDIYVLSVEGKVLRRITSDPASHGSPAWSPNGQSIAFLRYSERAGVSGVYIIPGLVGPERKVSGVYPIPHLFDRHMDWSPKENLLAVVDKESAEAPFRIYLVSAENGLRRPLTSPPPGSVGDTGPQFSPDGNSIAFRRTTSSSVNDLYVIPVEGGEARRITSDNAFIPGHAWTPDGREIIFVSRRLGSKTLWRISLATGGLKPILGIGTDAYFIAISRQKHRLAYSAWFADANIWRMTLGRPAVEGENPVPVIASTLQDLSPQYSPDGRRIAFRSNRSGTDEIWVAEASGRNPVQLTSFHGPLTGTPRWSPDGNAIAFDSRPGRNADIYVVGSMGGVSRRITVDPSDDVVPSWSGDGRWIYFGSNRTGGWQIWKAPVQGEREGSPSIQITKRGGFAAFESPDQKWLYYAKGLDVPGLWRVPVGGAEEEAVIPELEARYWGYWAVAEKGIYFLEPLPSAGCALRFFSFASNEVSRVWMLPKKPPYADSGLAVSRDASSILYPQIDHEGSNIMFVENFR